MSWPKWKQAAIRELGSVSGQVDISFAANRMEALGQLEDAREPIERAIQIIRMACLIAGSRKGERR